VTFVGAAGVAALGIFGLRASSSTNGHAPVLPKERLAGPPVSSIASDSKPKVVVFWASWCEPCAQEAPAIERFSLSAAGRGRVIGVDWNDGLDEARKFVTKHAWTFPNVRDGEGTVGSAYRLTGLPTTFVVDGRGRVRATLRGPQDEASLARALAAAGS
jgi:thiol-disulfide isomerase/thioredoxin